MSRAKSTKRNERQHKSGKTDSAPLSDRQRKAIPFIVTSPTYSQGCKRARLDRKTFYAWLRDPAFKAELDRQRDEVAAEALGMLSQSLTRAVETLSGLLDSNDKRLVRLTANDLIGHFLKHKELNELTKRVAAIEEKMSRRGQSELESMTCAELRGRLQELSQAGRAASDFRTMED
ncbi:MAG: hypothetical protein ACYTAS_10685 [Planctomycetota bacterium]|jgi:hypothetical protein